MKRAFKVLTSVYDKRFIAAACLQFQKCSHLSRSHFRSNGSIVKYCCTGAEKARFVRNAL